MFLIVRNLLALYGFQFIVVAVQSGEYAEERSQQGYAMLNTNYSTKFTQSYPDCVRLCFYDVRCASLNFCWDEMKCDLNYMALPREHGCPDCFVAKGSSTYMAMARFPGNVNFHPKCFVWSLLSSNIGKLVNINLCCD